MSDFTLQIEHIHKSYRQIKALNDFTTTLGCGVHALLGPNGSGKSTLMSILTQNLNQDEGEILCNGENICRMGKRYRRMIGYMPQTAGVFSSFTLYDFLAYMANLKELNRKDASAQIDMLIQQVELEDCRHRKLGTFSGGMKQRALLAQALLGTPSLLILDEPTAGLDPLQRINIKNILMQYASNTCILLATHIVPDIDDLATNLIFLKKGNIVSSGKPEQLKSAMNGMIWEIPFPQDSQEDLFQKQQVIKYVQRGNQTVARAFSYERPCETAVAVLPEIEDCYYYHFGETEVHK